VEPGKQARAARGGQLSAEFVCEHDSERHILGRLVRDVARHNENLIAGTVVLERAVVEPLSILGDFRSITTRMLHVL
jgi:hypothetical protein